MKVVAPEVMCYKNYGISADYFPLGVLTYELMMGEVGCRTE